MKKIINTVLFIILFLATKELIYFFYENWNFLLLNISNEVEYLKLSISIGITSFLLSFVFLILYFAFKELNIYHKTAIYFISLAFSLILVNFIYFQFKSEMNFTQIVINLIIVLVVFSILNFIFLQTLARKLNNIAEKKVPTK